jgi:carbon storage regulator
MLVLTRKLGEKVVIGESITVTVAAVDGGRVRLAIEAPGRVRILRGELAGRLPHGNGEPDPDLAGRPAEPRGAEADPEPGLPG